MGIFQTIGDLANTGVQKSRRKLQRAQVNAQISGIRSRQAFRASERPREQAHLNQSLFGRGLGKSTIADQDKARLTMIQDNQDADLARALHVAKLQKRYLKRQHKHEKISMWLGLLDGIVSIAAGAGGGAQSYFGGAGAGDGAAMGAYGGAAGGYNYGAGAGAGAGMGASMGGW